METENKPRVKEGDEIWVYVNGRIKCFVDHFATDGTIACDGVEYITKRTNRGRIFKLSASPQRNADFTATTNTIVTDAENRVANEPAGDDDQRDDTGSSASTVTCIVTREMPKDAEINGNDPLSCCWCGGRLVHNPMCDDLRRSWEPTLPFGKHKNKPLSVVPVDYLQWLANSDRISAELQCAIQLHLEQKENI